MTNCLNFGSPENPDVMWQFREAVHGLADGSRELGIPVSGGNVSFYNQTGDTPILPTPVVGVLGVIENVANSVTNRVVNNEDKDMLVILGETKDEFGGSVWQEISGAGLSGLPPQVDLANEARLADFFCDKAEGLTAAHDLSEGGLGQAVFEMIKDTEKGAELDLSGVDADAFTALFSESASRVLVACSPDRVDRVVADATELGIPVAIVGSTNTSGTITFADGTPAAGQSVGVAELREAWSATMPGYFAHADAPNAAV